MLDLQTVIEDTLLDNSVQTALQDYVWDIQWQYTEKGGWLDNFDYRTPGYSEDRICRKLTFNFQFNTPR